MKADIIPIGNSKGIRIPKALLEQCGFEEKVEIEVRDNRLILSKVAQPRGDWERVFIAMEARGDDALQESTATEFDAQEWEW